MTYIFWAIIPHWVYRAIAAEALSNLEEVEKCYNRFDEIWRPVLRKDVYKSMSLRYHLKKELSNKSSLDKNKIEKYLEEMRKYSEDNDWVTNILIGLGYFYINNKEKAEDSVLANIDSEYEKEISSEILEKMKAGKIDKFDFYLECLNCHGKGEVEITETNTCPKCKGYGTIPNLAATIVYSMKCNKCNGKGKITENKLICCEKCNGKGKVKLGE